MKTFNDLILKNDDIKCLEESVRVEKKLTRINICTFLLAFILGPTIAILGIEWLNHTFLSAIVSFVVAGLVIFLIFRSSIYLQDRAVEDYVTYLREAPTIFMINPYFKKTVDSTMVEVVPGIRSWLPEGQKNYYLVFKPFRNSDVVLMFNSTEEIVRKYEESFDKASRSHETNYIFSSENDLIMADYEKTTVRSLYNLE